MPAEGSRPIALDSSVAVPLLVHTHDDHPRVETWARGRSLALTSHSLAETYAVLTRLPDDLRVSPDDAGRLLARGFATPLLVKSQTARNLASVLASSGVAGGAVYDALVGLAAAENGCVLATRDIRARGTYEAVGADVEVIS
jgi:predicted nucleic acid-binding protein